MADDVIKGPTLGESPKQSLAIAALVKGATLRDAAKAAGVSERQVNRWMHRPSFSSALRSSESEIVQAAGRRLIGLADAAMDALEDVLKNPQERGANVKRLAAVSVIELAIKVREYSELEERLAALEGRVYAETKRKINGNQAA